MRAYSAVATILVLTIVSQSCTRDAATAPHLRRLSSQFTATSSPGRIAFVSNRNGNPGIYVMLPDGTGVTRLTDNSSDANPTWSPDGLRIAFSSIRDGFSHIWVMNADGSALTRLTTDVGGDYTPSWSPDGRRIAFISDRDDQPQGFSSQIYVMNVDGSNQIRLTNLPDRHLYPAWSPDGSRMVFWAQAGENEWMMNSDGTNPTQLLVSSPFISAVAWAPDGHRIVAPTDGSSDGIDLYLISVDGPPSYTRLTFAPTNTFPSFSPDGKSIAFQSNRDGNLQIYVMNADGSGQARITNDSTTDADPSWGPAPQSVGGVASVVVTPSSISGTLGQSAQFTATAHDAQGNVVTGGLPVWTSSDSTIVSVSATGYGTAVGVGGATLTATINGVSGRAQTTVTGDSIASIFVDPPHTQASPGMSGTITAALYDANGAQLSGRRVLWTSSNPAAVTIDSGGFAKAVGYGTVTITAMSAGKSGTATVDVGHYPSPVNDLSVVSTTDSSATLKFTQVDDGLGSPASYDVRYAIAPIAWGSAASVTSGTCATPVTGTAIGVVLTCTINGLTTGGAYNFQLVPFRGTLNQNAVFGPISNVASSNTVAAARVMTAPRKWCSTSASSQAPCQQDNQRRLMR